MDCSKSWFISIPSTLQSVLNLVPNQHGSGTDWKIKQSKGKVDSSIN